MLNDNNVLEPMKIHVPATDIANVSDVEQLNARLTLELEQLAFQNQMLRMGLPGSAAMATPPGLSPIGTPVASRPASPGPMSHQILMQHHSLALQNQSLVQENQALRLGAQFLGNGGFSRGGFSRLLFVEQDFQICPLLVAQEVDFLSLVQGSLTV